MLKFPFSGCVFSSVLLQRVCKTKVFLLLSTFTTCWCFKHSSVCVCVCLFFLFFHDSCCLRSEMEKHFYIWLWVKTEGGLGLQTKTHTHNYPLLGGFINMFELHTFNFWVWIAESFLQRRCMLNLGLLPCQCLPEAFNGWSRQRSALTKQNKMLISLEMETVAVCTSLIHVTADWC